MSLAKARAILANMPDEVFSTYIAPLVKSDGWPFNSMFDRTAGTAWLRYLGNHSLETIAKLRWKRIELPLRGIRFSPNSKETVRLLIEWHLHGVENILSQRLTLDSRERFIKCSQFSHKTGRVPVPCTLMLHHGQYDILDGNHRIAALAALGFEYAVLDSWVGHRAAI